MASGHGEWGVTDIAKRPTPAVPWPGVVDEGLPAPDGRSLPPELGAGAVSVLEGVSFMYSDGCGDVPPGSIGGLVHADTRLLSTWVLTLNGVRLLPLRSGSVEHYSAAFFLTNPDLPGFLANEFGLRRLRSVDAQLHERIELWCYARRPGPIEVRLRIGTDFADLFEIKDIIRDRSASIVRTLETDLSAVTFSYRNGDFAACTRVESYPPPDRVDGDELVWTVHVDEDSAWEVDLFVPFAIGPTEVVPAGRGFGPVAGEPMPDATTRWFAEVPGLESDSRLLCDIIGQTGRDLLALRVQTRLGEHSLMLPAAGLPWFLTVFGRDTLITAYQTLSFGQELARGALLELASLQGTVCDDFRDEEPGKILHEIRQGELTRLGLMPHSPYYGTADATMLWLIVLSEYWRWSGDDELVRRMWTSVIAAVEWIDRFGDRDGDGYVEYQTRSRQGLGNQCWRDSWDGVQFSDGRIPFLPIATCELQGYVYDAKVRVAELADRVAANPEFAVRLRREADQLKERFDADFWIGARGGYYALGLDGDKNRIDAMTSNIGHLLWSGIVPEDRAPSLVAQLMSEEMFSGWGVRTLSTQERGFNPIGYHLGTVWPHDNSLIAMGLARYGFRDEANRISSALIAAAGYTQHRLPEAFSGYARSVSEFPVPYPTACSPQAWAAASPLLLLRVMLGLQAGDGVVTVDPVVPDEIGRIGIRGAYALGAAWDIDALGRSGAIRAAAR